MRRWTLLISLLSMAGLAIAQQPSQSPSDPPPTTDSVVGTQLIAWTMMQEPRPVDQTPQPVPPPESRSGQSQEPQPAPTPAHAEEQSPKPNQQQPEPDATPASQSLTGTVMKAAGKFVLQTADSTTYILDDQDKARSFDGKRVKITGTLDRPTGILHIGTIELLS